jgi:hypothetical protein
VYGGAGLKGDGVEGATQSSVGLPTAPDGRADAGATGRMVAVGVNVMGMMTADVEVVDRRMDAGVVAAMVTGAVARNVIVAGKRTGAGTADGVTVVTGLGVAAGVKTVDEVVVVVGGPPEGLMEVMVMVPGSRIGAGAAGC